MDPYPGQMGSVTLKEGILLLQRLGTLEKYGVFDHPQQPQPQTRNQWESAFLGLMRTLCTGPNVPQVRQGGLSEGAGGQGQ